MYLIDYINSETYHQIESGKKKKNQLNSTYAIEYAYVKATAGFRVQSGSVEFYGKQYSFHEKRFPALSGTCNFFGSKLEKPTQHDKTNRYNNQNHLPATFRV